MKAAVFLSVTPATALPTSYLINAGDSAAYTDHNNNVWSADEDFTGGAALTTPATVPGTQDGIVFYDRRAGAGFEYNLPLANGTYTVQFFFFDPTSTTGQNVFNVTAQGQKALSNFDIVAAGGQKRRSPRRFPPQ